MNIVLWIIAVLALYGGYLNAKQNPNGFIFWMITNSVLSVHNFLLGEYAQTFLFGAYFMIAVQGYFKWTNKTKRMEKT